MTLRLPLIAFALVLPAVATAADYSRMIASAERDPATAASLWDAFCKGPTPTPDWVCDAIKAAEKPIRDDPGATLVIAQ